MVKDGLSMKQKLNHHIKHNNDNKNIYKNRKNMRKIPKKCPKPPTEVNSQQEAKVPLIAHLSFM